jgi:hypothetical protein
MGPLCLEGHNQFLLLCMVNPDTVPEFAGSNLAEAVGFFWVKKSSSCLPLEGK